MDERKKEGGKWILWFRFVSKFLPYIWYPTKYYILAKKISSLKEMEMEYINQYGPKKQVQDQHQ